MNLEDLRAVQSDERGTDSLQPLRDSFYRDVAGYIDGLREEREREAERADNPFDSEEVRRLTDEIETAEEVVEAIYERRVGKVVKRASLAAAGMSAGDEGLTDEEAELFAELVEAIEANRRRVFAAFEGEAVEDGADPAADPADAPERPGDDALDAGDVMGPAAGATDRGEDPPGGGEDPGPAEERQDPRPTGERQDPRPTGERQDPDPAADGIQEGRGERPAPAEDVPTGADERGADGDAAPGTDTDPDAASGPDTGVGPDDDVAGERPDSRRSAADPGTSAPDGRDPTGRADGPTGGEERVTLRITRDVGEIFGVDERTYTLGAEDVVTLPEENAKPLLDRDAAQKLD